MKKFWKISNNSKQDVKIACKTNSMASKGIILKPGQFCLAESQLTASIDAQERRGFIKVDREFDNSDLNLEFVKAYSEDDIKTDFEKAAENAEKYMNNTEE
jgi:hypothetical protein